MTFFNISVNKDIYHKTKKQKCDQNPDLAQPINGSAFKVFAQQADMKWNYIVNSSSHTGSHVFSAGLVFFIGCLPSTTSFTYGSPFAKQKDQHIL